MIVYKAENKVSGNVYIGQTKYDLSRRIAEHSKKSQRPKSKFHKALMSYGIENFDWVVIDTAKTKEELNQKEIYWINEYNSINVGYNMVEGGTGGYNEFAVKVNRKRKGKTYKEIYSSPEMVEKVLQSRRDTANDNFKNFTKQQRTKYGKMEAAALNNSGYKHSKETIEKIRKSNQGKDVSKETKKLISQKTKEAMKNVDWDTLMEKALIGREKYWNAKHQEDREKILELKNTGLKVKEIISQLNVSTPTYYARLNELKKSGLL